VTTESDPKGKEADRRTGKLSINLLSMFSTFLCFLHLFEKRLAAALA
jgi:hypothetical protein